MAHLKNPPYDLGVIHGRFQILHNDHLSYILSGKDLCKHLIVGVTNPDPGATAQDAADPARSKPENNPLTYYERACLVRSALLEAGLEHQEFTITPFPINFPELYKYYVPMDAVFFLSIYDEWGKRKLALFEQAGLRTHVLREVNREHKGISGTEVRVRMIADQEWRSLVPPAVAFLLLAWDIPARLRAFGSNPLGDSLK
jgi:nicotinamide-nucleotide adenylyltransferase